MKKLNFSLLALILVIFLSACGSDSTTGNNDTAQGENENINFPKKSITLIVPYDAGGGTDATARALANATEKHLGQSIGVVNKSGGGGAIGMTEGAHATPDGYTATMVTVELTTLPHLGLAQITYDDFIPVAQINFDPAAITVSADAPYDTFEEFLSYVEENPNQVQVGNSGTGAIWHLAAASLEQATGSKFTHVPFDGAAPAVTALLGGHIDAVSVSPAEVLTHVKAGKLKTLAILADERSDAMPDVPTLSDLGIDAVSVGPWRGITVPKGTPQEIVDILTEAFLNATEEEEFKTFMKNNGLGIVVKDGEDFGQIMQETHRFFGELIPQLELN